MQIFQQFCKSSDDGESAQGAGIWNGEEVPRVEVEEKGESEEEKEEKEEDSEESEVEEQNKCDSRTIQSPIDIFFNPYMPIIDNLHVYEQNQIIDKIDDFFQNDKQIGSGYQRLFQLGIQEQRQYHATFLRTEIVLAGPIAIDDGSGN